MPDPFQINIPSSFHTERLYVRSFEVDDAKDLHSALLESIDELRKYLWHLPWISEEQTIQSAKIRCHAAASNFLLRTDLAYLAFEKSTDLLVGSVGLHRTDWNLPKTEVGYWIRNNETGKGYATELVATITQWALDELGVIRVELITDEQNKASRAIAARCGFQLEGVMVNVEKAPDQSLRNNCIYAKLSSA